LPPSAPNGRADELLDEALLPDAPGRAALELPPIVDDEVLLNGRDADEADGPPGLLSSAF
jgi:hypothetical protein